jgi:hypothetical protein
MIIAGYWRTPNFSFEAFALARWEKSEAQIIAEFLHEGIQGSLTRHALRRTLLNH